MGFIEDLGSFLEMYLGDPVVYVLILFIFSILVAVILPIPIEIWIFWPTPVPVAIRALVLGAGKGVGSLAVFALGMKLETFIRRWSKYKWFRWFLEKSERFVAKYGYFALFILLSIPFMTDTIPLYLFSIFNKDGKAMNWKIFFVVNFLAGVTRVGILWLAGIALGIDWAAQVF